MAMESLSAANFWMRVWKLAHDLATPNSHFYLLKAAFPSIEITRLVPQRSRLLPSLQQAMVLRRSPSLLLAVGRLLCLLSVQPT